MSASAITTTGLSKTFATAFGKQKVHALRPLDLTIDEGEIFGLLGPNGAGKTTLVKLLLGIVHPTEGSGALFGKSVRSPEARQAVGFLPENHRFPEFLTGRQTLDLYARMSGTSSKERTTKSEELLERVKLSGAAHRKVKTYSKGMMQRLGLAQALMSDPKLVFLDEPTDGVDPVGRREISDLLLELKNEGVTLFLNSHLLSEVERVCTRVAILKEGRLVREGTVEDLTTEDRVWRLRCTTIPNHALREHIYPMEGSQLGGLESYRLLAADRSALNATLDHLRGVGVEIDSVEPQRQSLEDLFVDVVREK